MPDNDMRSSETVSTDDPKQWVQNALDEHGSALLRYAVRLLGGDVETAHDVVQDTFVKLCTANQDEISNHLAAWLYTVCRNRALDIKRKERRMSAMSDSIPLRNPADEKPGRAASPSDRGDPADTVEQPETRSEVFAAFDQLPSNQQEVLRLKFQSQLSYKSIAKVLNLSVSNVGYLIHTGLKTLREQLGATVNPQPATAPIIATLSPSSTEQDSSVHTSASTKPNSGSSDHSDRK